MITMLVQLLVLILVFGLVWWAFTALLPLPEPFGKIAQVLIVIIFIVILLTMFFGGSGLNWRS